MENKKKKPVYKPYNQHIQPLLPPSWDDFIQANHPVRVVNTVINKVDLQALEEQYEGGGRASYNPRMLLKLIVYGYLCNIYSSRRLEAFSGENIHCMWLTAMNMPDHNTINRFRSQRLKEPLKEIFTKVVELLIESGHVSLKDVYIDGTKIEANANKYTFVWGKAIKTNKCKMAEQLEELWKYTESVAKEEMQSVQSPDFTKLDAGEVEKTIESINESLKEKSIAKKVKQKISYGKKHWTENLKKYEMQEAILGERNSYSKTDTDATFMRLKDDHMMNGQLKAAYNVQVATNNQIVVSYSIHQKPSDTTTLPGHMEDMIKHFQSVPENVIADAGYGSEENYSFLEGRGIQAYVKYNMFDRERRKKKVSSVLTVDNLYYNETRDCYYCPMGQAMNFKREKIRITQTGYKQTLRQYEAQNCQGCPLRGACHRGNGDRVIEINRKLNEYRKQAEELLAGEQGIRFRKQRCFDVEPVFGNIKQNKGFKRFLLRGIKKVNIEIGLVALAHNLKKVFTLGMANPQLRIV